MVCPVFRSHGAGPAAARGFASRVEARGASWGGNVGRWASGAKTRESDQVRPDRANAGQAAADERAVLNVFMAYLLRIDDGTGGGVGRRSLHAVAMCVNRCVVRLRNELLAADPVRVYGTSV